MEYYLSMELNGDADTSAMISVSEDVFNSVKAAIKQTGYTPTVAEYEAEGPGHPAFNVLFCMPRRIA